MVPLQLGVRDIAFSTLNSVALGLTASGILLTSISLGVGEFAKTGWVAYRSMPPRRRSMKCSLPIPTRSIRPWPGRN